MAVLIFLSSNVILKLLVILVDLWRAIFMNILNFFNELLHESVDFSSHSIGLVFVSFKQFVAKHHLFLWKRKMISCL